MSDFHFIKAGIITTPYWSAYVGKYFGYWLCLQHVVNGSYFRGRHDLFWNGDGGFLFRELPNRCTAAITTTAAIRKLPSVVGHTKIFGRFFCDRYREDGLEMEMEVEVEVEVEERRPKEYTLSCTVSVSDRRTSHISYTRTELADSGMLHSVCVR